MNEDVKPQVEISVEEKSIVNVTESVVSEEKSEEKNDDEEYLEVREIKDTSTSYTFDEFIKKLNDINNDVLKKFNEINKSNR